MRKLNPHIHRNIFRCASGEKTDKPLHAQQIFFHVFHINMTWISLSSFPTEHRQYFHKLNPKVCPTEQWATLCHIATFSWNTHIENWMGFTWIENDATRILNPPFFLLSLSISSEYHPKRRRTFCCKCLFTLISLRDSNIIMHNVISFLHKNGPFLSLAFLFTSSNIQCCTLCRRRRVQHLLHAGLYIE